MVCKDHGHTWVTASYMSFPERWWPRARWRPRRYTFSLICECDDQWLSDEDCRESCMRNILTICWNPAYGKFRPKNSYYWSLILCTKKKNTQIRQSIMIPKKYQKNWPDKSWYPNGITKTCHIFKLHLIILIWEVSLGCLEIISDSVKDLKIVNISLRREN